MFDIETRLEALIQETLGELEEMGSSAIDGLEDAAEQIRDKGLEVADTLENHLVELEDAKADAIAAIEEAIEALAWRL